MDTPYRVEPNVRSSYKPSEYHIIHISGDVLCRTEDQVFAHKLIDLLNADVRRERNADRPS